MQQMNMEPERSVGHESAELLIRSRRTASIQDLTAGMPHALAHSFPKIQVVLEKMSEFVGERESSLIFRVVSIDECNAMTVMSNQTGAQRTIRRRQLARN